MIQLNNDRRKALGSFLREVRKSEKLPQATVAKHLGYTSVQYVSNVERGVCSPSMAYLQGLADLVPKQRTAIRRAVLKLLEATLKGV